MRLIALTAMRNITIRLTGMLIITRPNVHKPR